MEGISNHEVIKKDESVKYIVASVSAILIGYISYQYASLPPANSDKIALKLPPKKTQQHPETPNSHSQSSFIGLENLGNTCYMNSLFQALSGSQIYIKYVRNIVSNQILPEKCRADLDEEMRVKKQSTLDILGAYIMVLLQLCENDPEIDPAYIYKMLC